MPAGLAPYGHSGTQATGDSILTHVPMINRTGEGNAENQALAFKVSTQSMTSHFANGNWPKQEGGHA